jgi:crotonobetainyl-CoA:carnitine CoA-transferase CaiB-like acyl-CoA transferase
VNGGPLHDVRVLALEQYGAGPWGTMQLADLGADIIKVEDPSVGGDVSRHVPPYQAQESSLFFETFNRGKRSVSLDLRHPQARGVFEDLVGSVDAVFSNLRGDQPDKLGLRFADLEAVNPRIVCCSLSGFGMTGPRRGEGAYDYTLQGLAGWQSITGEPDGPPTKSGLSLVDFCGGYVAALAILAGVWRARHEGRGSDVDLSLFEVALAQLTYIGTWVASRDYTPVRRGDSAHQTMVPFQNFATADGWIVIACPKQALWEKLCGAIGHAELIRDPRFKSFAGRDENRAVLLPILDAALRSRPTAEWLDALTAAGVPCAPVNDVAAALTDVQAVARGAVIELEHPVLGTVAEVASPFRFDGEPSEARRGPLRGEDTHEVLHELCGYSESRIDEMAAAGVFGDVAPAGRVAE